MALYTVNGAAVISQADVNQFTNLLNGTTTNTQVTVANRIRAAFTGATTGSGGYVGQVAAAAPASGTFVAGDVVTDGSLGVAWVCKTGGSPGTWVASGYAQAASSVLGAPAASVTLSVPSGFNNLRLEMGGSSSATGGNGFDEVTLQLNGDTTANYSYHQITMINSTTVTGGAANAVSAGRVGTITNGNTTTPTGACSVEFPGAGSSTRNKQAIFTAHASSGIGAPNNSAIYYGGTVWGGTAAITSVKVALTSGSNFTTGSFFYLYGAV